MDILANAARTTPLVAIAHLRDRDEISPCEVIEHLLNVNCFPCGQSIFGNHMPAFSA